MHSRASEAYLEVRCRLDGAASSKVLIVCGLVSSASSNWRPFCGKDDFIASRQWYASGDVPPSLTVGLTPHGAEELSAVGGAGIN